MEKEQSNISNAVRGAKKKKAHFIASMAILAVAMMLVIAVVVVAVIAGIGKASLSGGGKLLHGSSAEELYAQIKDLAEETENYTVKLTKIGNAQLKDSTLAVNITAEIESAVKGDDFYYRSIVTTTYIGPKGADKSVTEVVREITVVDGVAYVMSGDEKTKQTVTDEKYKDSFDIFDTLLWETEGMFADSKFESVFAGGYKVAMSAADSQLQEVLYADMQSFFSNQMSSWIFPFAPVCSNAEYTVTYDNDCRPTDVVYNYRIADVIKSFVDGSASMEAKLSYGSAAINIPSDASSYTETE